jgi:hypothetical protein
VDPREQQRQFTEIVYLDVADPANMATLAPDGVELALGYRIVMLANGKEEASSDSAIVLLPITISPAAVPALVSAGIALGPYEISEDYRSTLPRAQHLWLEFDEKTPPGQDLYARVLAVAPDPLLADLSSAWPEVIEPALPIDSEWLRVIEPGQPSDSVGLAAMPMQLTITPDRRHYLLPLPPGYDAQSADLHGLFTIEFRYAHSRERWCTAHGRWGQPLRVAGIRYPPPTLNCQAYRVSDGIVAVAPFAAPVSRGRAHSSRMPNTRLWAMLYANVADLSGSGFRNLLIAQNEMTAETAWSRGYGT